MSSRSTNHNQDPASLLVSCLLMVLQLLWLLVSTAFQMVWMMASFLFALPLGIAVVLFIMFLFFFM